MALSPRHVRFTPKSRHWVSASGCPLSAKSGHMQCAPGCSVRRALHARDGYIRSHVGVHLSVPKKWSKVCADRGVQFELRSCLQCSEGRGERPPEPIRLAANLATVPGPVATSSTTAFGWRLHSSSNSSAHGSNSRGTSTSSYALGTVSSVNWKPVSSLMRVPSAHKAVCCARWERQRDRATTQKRDQITAGICDQRNAA